VNRINELISQSNVFGDKPKANKNWTDYTDSEDDNDKKNVNSLYSIRLRMEPISYHERREYVIKIKVEIYLEEKVKHSYNVDIDCKEVEEFEKANLIVYDDAIQNIQNAEERLQKDMNERHSEQEVEPMLP